MERRCPLLLQGCPPRWWTPRPTRPDEPQAPGAPKRKRLNRSEKRERKAAAWQLFVKLVGRKAQRGVEPNDRKHSKRMDRSLRRMQPELLDRLVTEGKIEVLRDVGGNHLPRPRLCCVCSCSIPSDYV